MTMKQYPGKSGSIKRKDIRSMDIPWWISLPEDMPSLRKTAAAPRRTARPDGQGQ